MEYLVMTLQGPQNDSLWGEIAKITADQECFITTLQGQNLGAEMAIHALIAGNWNCMAKLETHLKTIANEKNLMLSLKRTTRPKTDDPLLPYCAEIIGLDQLGMLHSLCEFFNSQGALTETLESNSYLGGPSHAPMFEVKISLNVPSSINIAELRDQFMMYCEELNVDGVLEPEK